jgi:hypothetical protein
MVQEIVREAQELVQLEVELAKQDLKEMARRNGIAIGLLAFGGLLVMLAVLVAVPVLIVLQSEHQVLSAAIWIATYVGGGAILMLIGRLMVRLEVLRKTLTSIEETKQWALRQIRSNGR